MLELAGERLLDAVDQRELGVPLPVSWTSRAFSSATLRLPASVSSSCWSDSLKACSRSMFWSETTPVARPPATSGTNRPTSALRR